MALRTILGLAIIAAVFALAIFVTGASPLAYFDAATALIILFTPVGACFISHGPILFGRAVKLAFGSRDAPLADLKRARALFTALGRYEAAAAVLGFFVGAIGILSTLSDMGRLGVNFAVALISVFQAALLLVCFILPLGARLDDRIIRAEGQ